MNNRTRSRTINGVIFNGKQLAEAPVTLRATSDELGKSISLSVDGLVMLQIHWNPFWILWILWRRAMTEPKELGRGVKFERIRRITGYLVGTLDRFNNAKKAEERDRVKHSLKTAGKH